MYAVLQTNSGKKITRILDSTIRTFPNLFKLEIQLMIDTVSWNLSFLVQKGMCFCTKCFSASSFKLLTSANTKFLITIVAVSVLQNSV